MLIDEPDELEDHYIVGFHPLTNILIRMVQSLKLTRKQYIGDEKIYALLFWISEWIM